MLISEKHLTLVGVNDSHNCDLAITIKCVFNTNANLFGDDSLALINFQHNHVTLYFESNDKSILLNINKTIIEGTNKK